MAFLCALAAYPAAGAPILSLPIDCTLGSTCYIEDYLDHDPSDRKKDYACGHNTRNGHRGTDIAILSFEAMQAGVDVLAAADGVVMGVRDNMPDLRDANVPSDRACGNGARIDHGDGWHTQYCHMKLGSLRLKPGQQVTRGQILGQIGLSDQSNHPHVHLSLQHNGKNIDPFATMGADTCGRNAQGLWQDTPTYYDTGFRTAGYSNHVPSLADVNSGAARQTKIPPTEPLVLYGHILLAKPGDLLHFSAQGPQGDVFQETIVLNDPRKSEMQAYGRKAPTGGWVAGKYEGTIRLTRDDTVIGIRHADVDVRN